MTVTSDRSRRIASRSLLIHVTCHISHVTFFTRRPCQASSTKCISPYMSSFPIGLGTRLRNLILRLDGDVQYVYDELDLRFKPRFYPIVLLLLDAGPQNVN